MGMVRDSETHQPFPLSMHLIPEQIWAHDVQGTTVSETFQLQAGRVSASPWAVPFARVVSPSGLCRPSRAYQIALSVGWYCSSDTFGIAAQSEDLKTSWSLWDGVA